MSLNVVTIDAPQLTSVDVEAVHKFLQERKDYLTKLNERNAQLGEESQIKPEPLKTSVDSGLLDYICDYELDEDLNATPDTVTEEQLKEYLVGICPKSIEIRGRFSLEKKIKKTLKDGLARTRNNRSMGLTDRVKVAWADLHKMFVNFGVKDKFEDKTGLKILRQCVLNGLKEERNLRKRLEGTFSGLSFDAEEARKSLKGLYRILIKCAVEQEREDCLNATSTRSDYQPMSTEEKKRKFGKSYDPNFSPRKKKTKRRGEDEWVRSTSANTSSTDKPKPDRSNIVCYNCLKRGHTVYQCRHVKSRAEADRIRKEYNEKNRNVSTVSNATNSFVDCTLGDDEVPARALLDSGAYTNFVDVKLARKANLTQVERDLPAQVTLAVQDQVATVRGAAIGTMILSRPSDGKKIKLRNAEFILLNMGTEMVLVGNDTLSELGISPNQQLNKLAVNYDYLPSIAYVAENDADHIMTRASYEDKPDSMELDGADYAVDAGDAHEAKLRLNNALEDMLEQSEEVFTNESQRDKLRSLVFEFYDIWRVNLMDDLIFGNTEPVRVPPFEIRLKPDAVPHKARMRAYNRLEREFMKKMTRELSSINCMYRSYDSRWSSASLIVVKPGKVGDSVEDFRWTGDLRYVNSVTETLAGSMPLMSSLLEYLDKAKYFATLDCHKGYWQIPLARKSQEICSFLTPHGVFSPTRLMQGHTDSVAVFQQTMEHIFDESMYSELLIWIDDLLAFAKTTEELLDVLRRVFTKCREFNLRISPVKTRLGLRSLKWCGRIVSETGIKFDPEMIQGLMSLTLPRTADELQHLLTASNWLRVSLPQYAEVVSELSNMLKESQKAVGSAKKTKLRKRVLEWDEAGITAFKNLKDLLSKSVELSHFHYEKDYVLCLFTDASDHFWGIILTQVLRSEWATKPLQEQKHEPLAFLSGTFTGSHYYWPMIIKEGYPIVHAMDRLRQYLSLKEFVLYTDHRNLVYLFNHLPKENDVKKNVSHMIQRWHVKLLSFNYVIEHIPGTVNIWADILSRFQATTVPVRAVLRRTSFDESLNRHFKAAEDVEDSQYLLYGIDMSQSPFLAAINQISPLYEIDIIESALNGSSHVNYSEMMKK